jgi:hypothetical protein
LVFRLFDCRIAFIGKGKLKAGFEKNDYNIFTKRCSVNRAKKIMTIFKIILEGKYL